MRRVAALLAGPFAIGATETGVDAFHTDGRFTEDGDYELGGRLNEGQSWLDTQLLDGLWDWRHHQRRRSDESGRRRRDHVAGRCLAYRRCAGRSTASPHRRDPRW